MAKHSWWLVTIFFVLAWTTTSFARNDDLVVLKNGDRVTGEIKGLQRGELKIKADYMIEAVRLDWSRVERVESKSTFMISLVNGQIFTNMMRLVPADSDQNFAIGSTMKVAKLDVIRIIPAAPGFWKRLEGSIDFGLSYASDSTQYQTQLTATGTYRTGDHSFTTSVDSAFGGQSEGSRTARNQFTFDYRKQLTSRLFVGGLFDLLQSHQQSLKLRTSVGGLVGRNLFQTDHTRLSILGGIAGTRENYTATVDRPRTMNADALAGVDFTTFRFDNTDIRSRISLFPSLTTPGRMRLQATSDLRIKLVKNLYWGFHFYESFDNRPPIRADKNELGVSTSLGWKF